MDFIFEVLFQIVFEVLDDLLSSPASTAPLSCFGPR